MRMMIDGRYKYVLVDNVAPGTSSLWNMYSISSKAKLKIHIGISTYTLVMESTYKKTLNALVWFK